MAGSTELSRFVRRSPAARAVLGIFRQLKCSRCGSLAVPAVVWLLKCRYPESTIEHACTQLHRLGAIVWTGGTTKTRAGKTVKVWRAA